MAVGALLALDRTKLQYPLAHPALHQLGWRIGLVTRRAGGLGVKTFQHEVFAVIEERGRFEGFLVVALGAVARLFAAFMHIHVAAGTLLIQTQHCMFTHMILKLFESKRLLQFFIVAFFAGQLVMPAGQREFHMGVIE